MSKKNFKNNNPALAFISNPEQREAQGEDNTQEEQLEKAPQKKHPTQGRKGQKLPRINMAFIHENLEYLQIMARIEGVSMTQYVNILIEADREKRADVIERAKGILKGVD